jgi:diadenylate cyclase
MVFEILNNVWRAALEVGIYYVLSFVKGTRGWPVFVGFLAVIAPLVIAATFLELKVLSTILRNFLFWSLVAIPIIFQPELRRMLGELGRIPLFNTTRDQRENIEVIVQGAEELSEARIGALIAIEQSINLEEAVESGIAVDCEATPEMLETIFFPNNAIHDGGVIIKGDRISRAACIYPLTRRQDLSRSMGTRHRAAIGLSEETDAVIVVVSEESGAISYAYKGELVRGVTLEELRAFLSSILVKTTKSRGNLADWLRSLSLTRPKPSQPALAKTESEP